MEVAFAPPAAHPAPPASRNPLPAAAPEVALGTLPSKTPAPVPFGPLLGAILASAADEPAPSATLEIVDLAESPPLPPGGESADAWPEEADGDWAQAPAWAGWIGPAIEPPLRAGPEQGTREAFVDSGEERQQRVPPGGFPRENQAASSPGLSGRDASLPGVGRQEPGLTRETPGSLRDSVLKEPGERGRAERLWGFWLRRGAEAAAAQSPEAAAEETLAMTGPRAPGPEFPENADGLARAVRPGETSPAEAPRGAAAAPPEGVREAAGPRPPPAPSPPHQVAHAVRMAVSRGGDRVTVRLEPEHLGKIEVFLAREPAGAGLTALLRVENAQAHQALTTEMPLLRQALEARGVNLVHVQVDLDDGRAGGERAGRGTGIRSRRGGGPQAAASEGEDLAVRAHPWRPWGFEALI